MANAVLDRDQQQAGGGFFGGIENGGNGALRRLSQDFDLGWASIVSTVRVNVVNERRRAECPEDGERPADPAPLGACEALAEEQGHADAEHKSGRGDGFEFLHGQRCFFHGVIGRLQAFE